VLRDRWYVPDAARIATMGRGLEGSRSILLRFAISLAALCAAGTSWEYVTRFRSPEGSSYRKTVWDGLCV
jgi:hypothetical protein